MPDIPGIPVDDVLEDAILPNRATIREALLRLVARERTHGASRAAYDPAIPQASSTIEVELAREHLRSAVDAVVEACAAFPRFNATFAWSGITEHPDVVVDLDLGASSPARGGGTITLVDYGRDGADLAVPFVRPNQTAALRIGAVRNGRAFVTCAVDHRAIDGADAGRFLAAFKTAIERECHPERQCHPERLCHPELLEGPSSARPNAHTAGHTA